MRRSWPLSHPVEKKKAVEGEEAVFGNKVLQKKKTFPCASFTFPPTPLGNDGDLMGTPPKKETARS